MADNVFSMANDLVNGENDWLNIQPVIRTTFKMLTDTIQKQQQDIISLNSNMKKMMETISEQRATVCYNHCTLD